MTYREEIGRHSTRDIGLWCIDELRIPNATICSLRTQVGVLIRQVRDLRSHSREVFADVVQGEEGVAFLVVGIKKDKFTVLRHHALHLPRIVDDNRPEPARVLVLVHADVRVVGKESALEAMIRSRDWCNEPIQSISL